MNVFALTQAHIIGVEHQGDRTPRNARVGSIHFEGCDHRHNSFCMTGKAWGRSLKEAEAMKGWPVFIEAHYTTDGELRVDEVFDPADLVRVARVAARTLAHLPDGDRMTVIKLLEGMRGA